MMRHLNVQKNSDDV